MTTASVWMDNRLKYVTQTPLMKTLLHASNQMGMFTAKLISWKALPKLAMDERMKLEEQTRDQASSAEWLEACRQRITGSKCGCILMQKKKKTVALLKNCDYPKPMLVLPKPIAWGGGNEQKACQAYVRYMNSHGHPGQDGVSEQHQTWCTGAIGPGRFRNNIEKSMESLVWEMTLLEAFSGLCRCHVVCVCLSFCPEIICRIAQTGHEFLTQP